MDNQQNESNEYFIYLPYFSWQYYKLIIVKECKAIIFFHFILDFSVRSSNNYFQPHHLNFNFFCDNPKLSILGVLLLG
jgi:hypothetical protein